VRSEAAPVASTVPFRFEQPGVWAGYSAGLGPVLGYPGGFGRINFIPLDGSVPMTALGRLNNKAPMEKQEDLWKPG
jgi:hypothetical protein